MKLPSHADLARAYDEAAATIEAFLAGTGGEWDWDDFTSIRRRDPFVESVRTRCISIRDDFPGGNRYCSAAGEAAFNDLARDLRARANALKAT